MAEQTPNNSRLQSDTMKAKIAMVTSGKVKDVMISHDVSDKEVAKTITKSLIDVGVHAWLSDDELVSGADSVARLGQAVVDCIAFMFVMSPRSVKSKLCQDQLALAYVSNKTIIPVALDKTETLLNEMENGMRLQLAGYEWCSVHPDSVREDINELANCVKRTLTQIKEDMSHETDNNKKANQRRQAFKRCQSVKNSVTGEDHKLFVEDGNTYWNKAFDSKKVTWDRFRAKVYEDFQKEFDDLTGKEDTEWLFAIIHRELNVEADEMVRKADFTDFCTVEGVVEPLWVRIQEQARESYAMREVFEIDSSVRVQAIENLGKYKSATVIEALRDLLSDKDVNVQAIAIISLARTGANDQQSIRAIRKCLQIRDRVVREAACLALGKLKAEDAIDTLVDLWRNDIISNVREAALVALKNIGGPKAEEAIRVTVVLENEIRRLSSL